MCVYFLYLWLSDVTPPVIKCPPSIEVNAELFKGYAEVSWKMPIATDNLYVQNVRIIEPKGIKKPPYNFPIGFNKVVYEATDISKLTSTCSFSIKVLGELNCYYVKLCISRICG